MAYEGHKAQQTSNAPTNRISSNISWIAQL